MKSKRIQVDEIWSFTYLKQKNGSQAEERCLGQGCPGRRFYPWTWPALDADSKLVLSWFVGGRDSEPWMFLVGHLRASSCYTTPECTGANHAH